MFSDGRSKTTVDRHGMPFHTNISSRKQRCSKMCQWSAVLLILGEPFDVLFIQHVYEVA